MNRILTISFLLIICFSYGQKLKKQHYQVKYIKPPKSDLKINKEYTWEVEETTLDPNMRKVVNTYLTKGSNYGRGQFFASYTELGSVPGFKKPQSGFVFNSEMEITPSSLIKVKVGIATIEQVKPGANGRVNPNDTQSPIAKVYDVWISVPLDFDMRYAVPSKDEITDEFSKKSLKNVQFIPLYSLKEEGTDFSMKFQFPKDLKLFKLKKGFSNTAELDLQFVKHKRQFIKECKDRVISAFLKRAKLEVESNYSYAKRDFPIHFYYIKDKENRFSDLASYANMFKEVEPLLKTNIDSNNRMNWFTADIKAYTAKLLEFHTEFIDGDELPELVKTGARYNRIWLLFLNSNFNRAMDEINALNELQAKLQTAINNPKSISKQTKKEYRAIVDDIAAFDLEIIEEIITDFQPRYETNKTELGW